MRMEKTVYQNGIFMTIVQKELLSLILQIIKKGVLLNLMAMALIMDMRLAQEEVMVNGMIQSINQLVLLLILANIILSI